MGLLFVFYRSQLQEERDFLDIRRYWNFTPVVLRNSSQSEKTDSSLFIMHLF